MVCQRVKIPYQVLAFSDVVDGGYRTLSSDDKIVQKFVHNEYNITSLKLIEFFTSEQTKKESMDMMKYLLGYSYYWNHRGYSNDDLTWGISPIYINQKYNLGDTP